MRTMLIGTDECKIISDICGKGSQAHAVTEGVTTRYCKRLVERSDTDTTY